MIMNVKVLINALRFGQAVGKHSPWRWAGAVGLVAGFGFYVAKANGLLDGVAEEDWMSLVQSGLDLAMTMSLYAVVATNEKVGILPKVKERPVVDEYFGDVPMRDHAERLSDPELPSSPDAANQRSKSSEFPDGPFWDHNR
jgi:hypothetical protein